VGRKLLYEGEEVAHQYLGEPTHVTGVAKAGLAATPAPCGEHSARPRHYSMPGAQAGRAPFSIVLFIVLLRREEWRGAMAIVRVAQPQLPAAVTTPHQPRTQRNWPRRGYCVHPLQHLKL
jgi:hypothetical protein